MFYFRLALALHMTVDELLDRTSSQELSEWWAYCSIEPLPNERQEMLLADIAAILTNVHRDRDHTSEVTPLDFLPWLDNNSYETSDDEPMHPDAMVAYVEALNAAFGGQDLREKNLGSPGVTQGAQDAEAT
jgi:hypothetical protein